MAKRSRMSMQKRQREIRKAEKAAQKRAKRHGLVLEAPEEPSPTIGTTELLGLKPAEGEDTTENSHDGDTAQKEGETP